MYTAPGVRGRGVPATYGFVSKNGGSIWIRWGCAAGAAAATAGSTVTPDRGAAAQKTPTTVAQHRTGAVRTSHVFWELPPALCCLCRRSCSEIKPIKCVSYNCGLSFIYNTCFAWPYHGGVILPACVFIVNHRMNVWVVIPLFLRIQAELDQRRYSQRWCDLN